MIGRQDNENLYLIYSDDLYTWDGGQSILQPEYPWEFVQIGNCGSPIELDDCWLLLTHGVGPVRKYSIGAVLLDKKDPSKILARSREPIIHPEPSNREGYVPNVVYTCGALRHGDRIILPYAISDTFSNFATIKIAALMDAVAKLRTTSRGATQMPRTAAHADTLHRTDLYRRHVSHRPDADRRRETCGVGLRRLVRRKRGHGCILLREVGNSAGLARNRRRRLAWPHVPGHGEEYGISIHARKVGTSSLSFIMPNDGKRAIVRCRDDDYLLPFPILDLSGCRALHLDGHQPDAAIHYAKLCRDAGILTSLDGGGLRSNTHELLGFIDVAIVAERLCEQMGHEPPAMLDYLKSRGCRIGGVTLGERGLIWYDETGTVRHASGARRAVRSRDRYQRGRRRLPRRLYLFLPHPSGEALGGAFPLRASGIRLQDPTPRQ